MRQYALLVLCLAAVPVHAQPPPPAPARAAAADTTTPTFVASLGQPSRLRWTVGGAAGWADSPFGLAAAGLQRDLLNPLLGVASLHGEVYLRAGARDVVPGLRARLFSPFARVGAGADLNRFDGADLLLSFNHPIRRGGLFHDGSTVRLDYLPGRGHAVTLGVESPVFVSTRIGRSRPRRDHAVLPRAERARALPSADLADVRRAAAVVRTSVFPLGPVPRRHPIDAATVHAELSPLLAAADPPATGEAAVLHYHAAVEASFARALMRTAQSEPGRAGAGDTPRSDDALSGGVAAPTGSAVPVWRDGRSAAAAVAAAARAALLAEVLLPWNRLLGQRREPDSLVGLFPRAQAAFAADIDRIPDLHDAQRDAVHRVFAGLLDVIEENRAALRDQWWDSRFVWLPLQFALLPDEHHTQAQLDALIEQATGTSFTDGNFVSYVVNEQFQYHLNRTIREATDYHVLWTHDFRGIDAAGDIDEMGYRHVVGSYLAALTARVRDFDRTGSIPAYFIIIDQWFYEVNRGRLWLSLLEDPLHHRISLPAARAAWADSIAAAQHELREAVRSSALLQEHARRHGAAWLRNMVRVHVNVTNPADASFWSTRVAAGVPLPDNMMRDHRKMVFFDITEEDPYRGEALFTGAGIGEHYANLSWEDRSLLVRGPALLPLKAITRDFLTDQGIPRRHVPGVLRPRPLAADYDQHIRDAAQREQQPLRALQLHNGAGFDDKQVNVAKALLYTLMPPGSVLKIPDSLWNSDFWASLLLGCALNGGRVLIVAPAAPNAPADAFGTLGRSRETLTRLLTAERMLRPAITAAGGLLRVGMFHSTQPVNDIPAKVRLAHSTLTEQDWLLDLFGFPASVIEELGALAGEIEHLSMAPEVFPEFEYDPSPKLHLKANFFASPEAWTLMRRPEWASAAWAYMQIRVNQLQSRPAAVQRFEAFPDAIADVGGGMVSEWHAALDAETARRVVFYTLMGSHNQNSRSMVIDAEVGILMSGWPAIIPHIDFIVLAGQSTWLEGPEDLAPLLPLDTGWKRRLAHWFRLAL